MVAYHPRRYVSSWLIAKAMPPYETYAASGGRRLTVWRAERRSSPARRASLEHLLRAPPLLWRWSVPRAPRYPKPPRTRSAGRRSGPGPTRSPPPLPRGPPPLSPHANPPHPPGPAPRRRRRGAPPRGAPGRVPVLRRRSGGPGQAWSGAGTGTVDLGPVVLGELGRARRRGRASDRGCTSGAARAAPPGQRRQGNAAGATPPGPA